MGILCQSLAGGTLKMKTVALLSLIAVAFAEPEADADPYLLYGGYGLGHYGYRTYGYPYTYGYYGKRSADAEPEAKPYYYGGYYGGYARPYYGGYGYRAYWG